MLSRSSGRMNGGLRGPPTTCVVKNVDQMEIVNPYSNGIPKDLPNKTKDNHWVSKVDEKEAEESLSLYCKPVELYNIIQQRSEQKPLFLQRCLSYKINAALQRRIRMTVSVNGCAVGKSKGKDITPCNSSIVRSVFVMVTRAVTYPTEELPGSEHKLMDGVLQGQVVYQLQPAQNLEFGGSLASAGVSFILPEIRKLVQDGKNGDVLFVMGDPLYFRRSSNEATFDNCTGSVFWGRVAISVLCLNWLKHATDYLLVAPNAHVVESKLMVELRPGNLQLEDSKAGKIIRISATAKTIIERSLVQLQVLVSGGEIGQTTVKGKPANGKCPQLPSQPYSLSHFRSSKRVGRVVYHYLYYHGMLRKTEVTEDFSCPFCLNGCASFKGLQGHLNASHDLFNFGYMVSGELQVVTVTCRPDVLAPEGTIRDVDGLDDPRSKDFFYWFQHSRLRRRRLPLSSGEHLQVTQSTHALSTLGASDLANGSDSREGSDLQEAGDQNNRSVNATVPAAELADADKQNLGDSSSQKPSNKHPNGLNLKGLKHGDTISLQQEPRKLHDADGLGLVVKQRSVLAQKRQRMKGVLGDRTQVRSRSSPTFGGACASAGGQDLDDCGQQQSLSIPNKAAIDRPDIPRTHALLQKRQYFHSHTAQPMDPEDLFGDRDSEDEIDSVIADLEDQRMLDDFVDVTPEEKEVMHLWNSFVRRNRVVADGHCPWACGEFARENAQLFRENPALRRCLMLFLVKLWNHHLVDGPTINQCLTIVDSYVPKEQEEPKK